MSRPVTFGLINTFGNPGPWFEAWPARYTGILEQIEWIDRELPIDGIYVTEHHFYDDGYLPSPLVMCGAIAARTRRVEIGTNLVQIPLHNPVRLAEDSLVVDAISGGRFRLGIGMGYYHQEFDGLGVRLKERVSRTEEAVDILRLAFAGEPFSYQGRRFALPNITVTPKPVRPGGPPIYMGAFAPVAVDRAVRIADGFLAFDPATVQEYIDACDRHQVPAEKRRLNATYWAIIAEDPEREFAQAGDNWLHLLNEYIRRDAYPAISEQYQDPASALADGLITLTDAAGAIAKFNADIDNGVTDFNFVTLMPGEKLDRVADRLQYLSDKVIPFVKQTDHPSLTADSDRFRLPLRS